MTTDRDEALFEALMREARDVPPPGDDLVARVLADASAVQAARFAPSPPAMPVGRGLLRGLVASLGGWQAVSGVTLAGLTGLVVGFAAPDLVDSWSGGQIWTLTGGGEAMPEIGALWDGTWDEVGDV